MVIEWQIAITFQGLVVLWDQDYTPTTWRTIGLAWTGLALSAAMATTAFGKNPRLWKGVSAFMFATVVAIIVSVLVCADQRK